MINSKLRPKSTTAKATKSGGPSAQSTMPVSVPSRIVPLLSLLVLIIGSIFAFQLWGWIYFSGLFFIAAAAGLIWTEQQSRTGVTGNVVRQSQVNNNNDKSVNTGSVKTTQSAKASKTTQRQEPFISGINAPVPVIPNEDNGSVSEPGYVLELHNPGTNPVAVMRILQEKLEFTADQAKQLMVEKRFPVRIALGDKRDMTVNSLLLKKAGAAVSITKQEDALEESSSHLRAIGYWITLISEDEFYPPHDFVGEYESGVKDLIVGYLDSGEVFQNHNGKSWCRFNCGIADSDLGSSELTDGMWVWPEGLSHYVSEHNVLLPTDFIEHVKSGGSQLTVQPNPEVELDFDFWLDWCKQHSSGQGSLLIRKAREHADALGHKGEALLKKYRNKRATLVENAIGLSDDMCQTPGCQRHALKDMTYCAEHHMNPFMGQGGFKPDAEFFELSKKHKQFHDALEKFVDLKYVLNRPV